MGRTSRLLRPRRGCVRASPGELRRDALARLAANFADDVKNPLAALKGAAEFLVEEQQRRGAPAEEGDFVALILREVERLQRAVESHERALSLRTARRRW